MKIVKVLFYIAMIIGNGIVIHNTSNPGSGEVEYITFTMLFSIFYWIYRIIRIAIDQMDEDNEDYYRAYNRKHGTSTWDREKYYKKYQPQNGSYVYDSRKEEIEHAEKIGEKIKIRTDIKIIQIKK